MTSIQIGYTFLILATVIVLSFYFKPFRLILKGLVRSALGFLSLFLLNFAGGYIGINVGINVVNGVFVGLLGLPGAAALLAVQGILS